MSRITEVVEAKLAELDAIPIGVASGRRLEIGGMTKDVAREGMRRAFTDIGMRVGVDWLEVTPVVALEQFSLMSAIKDHDTAGLFKSLINSFLVTYLTPETNDRAFECLRALEALRAEVGESRPGAIDAARAPTKH